MDKTPDTRDGTCQWCGKHNQTLHFIVWISENRIVTDWVCDRCRSLFRTATVNENED